MSSPCDPPDDAQRLTQCSVLLLLQEASKLAAPAAERSSPGENPSAADPGSGFSGPFCVLREWEVMRLINQQCERLLRSGPDHADPDTLADPDTPANLDVPADLDASADPDISADPGSSDVTDTLVARPVSSSGPTLVYSSELAGPEETRDPADLAELIKSSAVDEENSSGNASVLYVECWAEARPAGRELPLDLCLGPRPEREAVSLKSAPAHTDFNNNLLEAVDPEPRAGRRRQRKQTCPARSPDLQDAVVQGITFSMRPELDTAARRSRLVVSSRCSEEIGRMRSSRSRSRPLHTHRSSSEEEESDACGLTRSKVCASCRTRKTPLWRDAEDGTPLCNACGIRYKKYRVRCQQCWNIPRKEANAQAQCPRCGDALRLRSSCW